MAKDGKDLVLFVCIENSSRSQMAEGFAQSLGMNALSAGTVPAVHLNALVVQAMHEKGIDISKKRPRGITPELVEEAKLVVLTDASLEKSLEKGVLKKMRKKLVSWSIPDPQGKSIEEIRWVRDEIERMVNELSKSSAATNPRNDR